MSDASQGAPGAMRRVQERLKDHETRIRKLELSEAGATQWRESTTEKLDGIEDSLKWVTRLVLGGLILAAITFVIAGGLNVAP